MKRTRSTKGGKPGDEMMLSRVSDGGELPDDWAGEGMPELRRRAGSVRPTEIPEPRIAGMARQQPSTPPVAAAPPGRVRVRETRNDSSYSYEYSSESGETTSDSGGAPATPQEGYAPRQLMQNNMPAPVPPSEPPPPMQPMMAMLPPATVGPRPSEDPGLAWRAASMPPEPFAAAAPASMRSEPFATAASAARIDPMMTRAASMPRYIIPASVGVVLAGVAITFALVSKSSAAHPSADAPQANAPATGAAIAAATVPPAAKSADVVVAQAPAPPPASAPAHPAHAPKWHAGAKRNKVAAAAAPDNAQAASSPVGAYSVAPAPPPAPADKKPVEDEAAAELGSSLK